ncbi:hypothetical protein DFR42_10345 [Undibacterium pigrum]|uniref:Uncharacterized protein n=1 Tax=Undibacterium pigrum TaxID=401470 RepID=A0A318JAE2_9BURK|nr:hypothetical protein DFR42_10345 [Undibacterium pigrum]
MAQVFELISCCIVSRERAGFIEIDFKFHIENIQNIAQGILFFKVHTLFSHRESVVLKSESLTAQISGDKFQFVKTFSFGDAINLAVDYFDV